MRIDPKELPIPMQEQLAEKILAQMPTRDTAAEEIRPIKVRVRRLRFPALKDKWRYLYLRDMVRDGKICDLILCLDDAGEYVRSFSYLVVEEL